MKRQYAFLGIALTVASFVSGQNVNISDVNFKLALINDYSINIDHNTEISLKEASDFTGEIYVYNRGIKSLAGIEAFVNANSLNASKNLLTGLDISKLTWLRYLDCSSNQITSLDVSKNEMLYELRCYENKISALNLINNNLLYQLECFANLLSSLDISKNTSLQTLSCGGNNIGILDISNNKALKYLSVDDNPISILDVRPHYFLTSLHCYGNKLNALNVSKNTYLTSLDCRNNFNLETICVASVNAANANPNFRKNTSASWTEACIVKNNVHIPDPNFKALLVADPEINTDKDSDISYAEASAFTGGMHYSQKNISDLTGIEAFVNIAILDVSYNNLTFLDVTQNTVLHFLDCSANALKKLNVSKNTMLATLYCRANLFDSLDVRTNTKITYLDCSTTKLTSLDVSKNTALINLACANTLLETLDVSKNLQITSLVCNDNRLLTLDVSKLLRLNYLHCINNPSLTYICVTNINYANNWFTKDVWASFTTNCNLTTNMLEGHSKSSMLALSPNPAKDELFILSDIAFTECQLQNVLGKSTYSKRIEDKRVNISDLEPGLYFITFLYSQGKETSKFIKE